jgi:hypothetical protein
MEPTFSHILKGIIIIEYFVYFSVSCVLPDDEIDRKPKYVAVLSFN